MRDFDFGDFCIASLIILCVLLVAFLGLYIHADSTNIVTHNATIEKVYPVQVTWISTGKSITPIYHYYVDIDNGKNIVKVDVGGDRHKLLQEGMNVEITYSDNTKNCHDLKIKEN